jgi:hypothetical protein
MFLSFLAPGTTTNTTSTPCTNGSQALQQINSCAWCTSKQTVHQSHQAPPCTWLPACACYSIALEMLKDRMMGEQLLRRLAIICLEDGVLHPQLPLVVWCMMAVVSSSSSSCRCPGFSCCASASPVALAADLRCSNLAGAPGVGRGECSRRAILTELLLSAVAELCLLRVLFVSVALVGVAAVPQSKGYVLGGSVATALLALVYQMAAVGHRDFLPDEPTQPGTADAAAGGPAAVAVWGLLGACCPAACCLPPELWKDCSCLDHNSLHQEC